MALQKDLREFIACLNSSKVEYVIVGAYALAHHGLPRLTGDIDFFIRPSADNAKRLVEAISDFSNGALSISLEEIAKPDRIIRFGREPNQVDILTGITGVSFDAAWSEKVAAELDGLPVYFISRRLLIENKRATGRQKDLRDVDELLGR